MLRTFRRRGFLQFVGLAGVAAFFRTGSGPAAQAGGGSRAGGANAQADAKAADAQGAGRGRKPNFLVVVVDDMGYSDIGCYGGEAQTPVLDKLAANGLRFTQCYSTARCWPSRSCLLTGYYAQQVNMDPPQRESFPKWGRVLPHYLKPLGYRCYTSGKWHLMNAPKPIANGGFHRSYVTHDHDRHFYPKNHELDDKKLPPVEPGSDYYSSTAIASRAIEFLKQHDNEHKDEPFLMYLAFIAPHFPLQAPKQDIAKYKGKFDDGWDACRKRRWERMTKMGLINCALSARDAETVPFWNESSDALAKEVGPDEVDHAVAWDSLTDEQKKFQSAKMAVHTAMVDRNDQEIGRVLEQVKAMGAFEDTVILFVSDNGASAEFILRGDRNDKTAEPGSPETYLCLGPGWSTASNTPFRRHKSWVHEGGVASPLIVHWPAGIQARGKLRHTPCHFVDVAPTLVDLAGGTVEPTWKGLTPPPMPGKSLRETLASDTTIQRDYIYFHHMDNKALRVGDWKIVCEKDSPWELYDLRTDRAESNNQAAAQPERVKQMTAIWQKAEDQYTTDGDDKE